jgi:hypothetical protein
MTSVNKHFFAEMPRFEGEDVSIAEEELQKRGGR